MYEDFLAVQDVLTKANVPIDGRVMYYVVISWWRHPTKRWNQKRELKHIGHEYVLTHEA